MFSAVNTMALLFGTILVLKKIADMDLPHYVKVVVLTTIISGVAWYFYAVFSMLIQSECRCMF